MIKFSKSGTVTGKLKFLAVNDGIFVDAETGEQIDLARIIESVVGTEPFDMTLTQKSDTDITPEGGE